MKVSSRLFGLAICAILSGVLVLPAMAFNIGDSQKCSNVSWPQCSGNPTCSGSVTAEVIADPMETCGAAGLIKITVDMTCGTTVCKKVIYVCGTASGAQNFKCDGVCYSVSTTATWGGLANGDARCTTVSAGCGTCQ